MSQWTHVLSERELDANYALTASLDPCFASEERAFYESASAHDLRACMNGAWFANDPHGYQMARSYLAMREG